MMPEKISFILKLLSVIACLPVIIILSLKNYRVETEYFIASFMLSVLLSGLFLAKLLLSEKFKSSLASGTAFGKILSIASAVFLVPAVIIICMLILMIIGLSVGVLHITM